VLFTVTAELSDFHFLPFTGGLTLLPRALHSQALSTPESDNKLALCRYPASP